MILINITEKSSKPHVNKSWGAVILYVLKWKAHIILLLNKRVFKLSGLNYSKRHWLDIFFLLCAIQGNNLLKFEVTKFN
jgi:hypothetical protein